MVAIPKVSPRARARAVRDAAFSTRNRVRLLHDGDATFDAMLDAIGAAQHEVLLEMYWFASDQTGKRFARALSARAREGVDVRIIYDSVGSLSADGSMFAAMAAAGCRVHEFHPVAPWRKDFSLGRINRRTHRKLLVVDGRLAITGGINLGDPWASVRVGGLGFRDDAIEVEGEAARQMRRVFFRSFPEGPGNLPAPRHVRNRCRVTVLGGDQAPERRGIRQGYLDAIQRAERDIIICNSYFIPDRRTRASLYRALRHGVRVRVLMPCDGDVRAVQYASRALYEQLMARGVELYEWHRGTLHSKTAVVDDTWCTVGSFNFDARSLLTNLEMNLAVEDRRITQALRQRLEEDLALSHPVDAHSFAQRPPHQRALERLCFSVRWAL